MEKKIISGVPKRNLRYQIPGVLLGIGILSFIGCLTFAGSVEAENVYIILGIIFVALGIGSYFYMSRCEISVTDKRVYGVAAFGKRVDLPIDSISAVGMGYFNGITVASSSGRVSFFCIENNNEVHKSISELLLLRQENKGIVQTNNKPAISQSSADELMKYKELMDNGVISKEEFDAKKKQLLGM